MRDETREKRQKDIAMAAYALLETNGYAGTSMLSVAKAAKASNETLYRWYGDKQGLFAAMVQDNAAETRHLLNDALQGHKNPMDTLRTVAPVLLGMLVGDRAILLNRAAAAEPTGDLGAVIAKCGRDAVLPLLDRLIGQICDHLRTNVSQDTARDWFLSLLIGDLQIRRAIGTLPPLEKAQIRDRASHALIAFVTLLQNIPKDADSG